MSGKNLIRKVGLFVSNRRVLGVFALAMVTIACGTMAHAQSSLTPDLSLIEIDYSGVITSLAVKVGGALVAAIGLGVCVWGGIYIYRLIRRSA
jgi:hypothetical protein